MKVNWKEKHVRKFAQVGILVDPQNHIGVSRLPFLPSLCNLCAFFMILSGEELMSLQVRFTDVTSFDC